MEQYINLNGAYFLKTASGLSAVSDPTTLQKLQNGQIKATSQSINTGTSFSSNIAMSPTQTNQPITQPSSSTNQINTTPSSGYINVGGAYFLQTPTGPQAVSDPNTLRQLQSGQLSSTVQSSLFSQPTQQQTQQPTQQTTQSNQISSLPSSSLMTNSQQSQTSSQTAQQLGNYVQTPQGTYFQQTDQGLATVNDPNVLRDLQSGNIKASPYTFKGNESLTGFTNPELIPDSARNDQATKTISQISNLSPTLGNVLQGGGVSELAISNPLKFVSDIYAQLYKDSGLADIKAQFEEFTKQIQDITNERGDKIEDVNNNPWLSEAQRSKKVKGIIDKYEDRISAATNRAKLLEGMYHDGLDQVRWLTGQALNIYNDQADFQQQVYIETMRRAADREDAIFKEQLFQSRPQEVSAGASIIDPTSGQIIATAPKTTTGSTSSGTSTGSTSGGIKFTSTQLNKGAVNAGLSVQDFQGLNYDVQNYYINSSSTQLKAMNEAIANVKSGTEKPADVKNEIDNSNLPPTVKEYLKAQIDAVAPATTSTSSWWDKVKNFFGF